VRWLQGLTAFGDIRQPVPAIPAPTVNGLDELSRQACLQLAEQQGFAGHLTFAGQHFTWSRNIDYQPKGPLPDVGSLRWQNDVLIETGRDIDYVEHWHRDSSRAERVAAAAVFDQALGVDASLIRVDSHCIFARNRSVPLPAVRTLAECVALARTDREAQAYIDCEISYAEETSNGWLITASTLPFRVGKFLQMDFEQRWKLLAWEGDLSALKL
jgi:hypothetical protein